jgi:hypothetical protein
MCINLTLIHVLFEQTPPVTVLSKFEELCLLGYNALQSIDNHLMFRRNLLPPSSGLKKQEASMKHVARRAQAVFLLNIR